MNATNQTKEVEVKKLMVVFSCLSFCILLTTGCTSTIKTVPVKTISGEAQSAAETQLPKSKQTDLGLYITAKEAYEQWKLSSGRIKIIDCRTPEEYVFVGHAPMAFNIPGEFFAYKFDAVKNKPMMVANPDFLHQVKKKFQTDDTIFIMCRSGGRSAKCVNILAEGGFKNVFNIIDGFEGDKVKDPGSYFDGKRMRNGWKNSGAPWTYKLDPEKMHLTQ